MASSTCRSKRTRGSGQFSKTSFALEAALNVQVPWRKSEVKVIVWSKTETSGRFLYSLITSKEHRIRLGRGQGKLYYPQGVIHLTASGGIKTIIVAHKLKFAGSWDKWMFKSVAPSSRQSRQSISATSWSPLTAVGKHRLVKQDQSVGFHLWSSLWSSRWLQCMLVVNNHGGKKQKKKTYCDLGDTWFCLRASPQSNNIFSP